MISQDTIEELEKDERGWQYILGARMRSQNEVRDDVLARAGRYRVVHPARQTSDDPSPLKVKEVWVEGRRYVVCLNEDEARKDAADREAIVAALREKLRVRGEVAGRQQGLSPLPRRDGAGSLPDRRGEDRGGGPLRRQVGAADQHRAGRGRGGVAVQAAVDGGGTGSARASRCWRRGRSSTGATRRSGATCSARSWRWCCGRSWSRGWPREGHEFEWADVIRDLDRLQVVEVEQEGKRFLLRSEVQGTCGAVFRAAGVAVPPTVRQALPAPAGPEADPGATPRA